MGALFAGQSERGDASPTTELFKIYVQYKKDTRAIVSWLLSHRRAERPTTSPGRLSVRDLIAIADQICGTAVAMPEAIAFQFRQAITARTHLSRVFRKVSKERGEFGSTETHEYFTSSLTQIYSDLCKHCSKTCKHQEDHTSRSGTCSSRFESLRTDTDEIEPSSHSDMPSSHEECTEDEGRSIDSAPEEAPSTIHDDGLSNAFELYQQVHEVHRILSEVKTAWRKAAQGSSQLVTATIATNAAYTQLEDVEHRLTTSCSIANSADLLESYMKLCNSFEVVTFADTKSKDSAVDAINDLNDCWHAMVSLRSEAARDGFAEQALKPRSPPKINLQQGPDTSALDAQCREVLLYNVAQCIQGSCLRNSFIRLGSPVVAEVDIFMSREQTPSNCLHCASGLSLLMSSYKAYAFALPAGQCTSNCRIHALRYAQGAIAHISAVLDDTTMPCRCHGTLAFHLEKLKRDLEDYLRTKMFDLFFQSPWVCGGQILEMMHALRYYGLRLAAYKSYMGSVVHMYNVLRKIHDFPPIPVLEAICEHLGDLFFPGGRPDKRTFKTSYVRYLGARLRFHSQARHQTGCHALAIPAHAAKATAGFMSGRVAPHDPRFDCGRLSLMYRIKERNYRLDAAVLDAINGQAQCNDVSHSDVGTFVTPKSSRSSSRRGNGTCGHVLVPNSAERGPTFDRPSNFFATGVFGVSQALQQTIDAELASTFPIASLNFFPLYLDCVRIVDRISNTYHDAKSKQGHLCLCYADILVAAADGCKEGKGWRVRKEIRDLVGICGKALTEELGGRQMSQYYQSPF